MQGVRVPGLDVAHGRCDRNCQNLKLFVDFGHSGPLCAKYYLEHQVYHWPIQKLEFRSNENDISCWMVVCKNILCYL